MSGSPAEERAPRHHWRRPQLLPALGLTALWVALWSDVSVGNVLAGLLLALVVTAGLPLPPVRTQLRVRPLRVAALALRVLGELAVASVQVAWLAVRPQRLPRSAIVAVPLRVRSDLLVATVADLVAIVPGTAVVDVRDAVIYVHVLDAPTPEAADRARAGASAVEERVVRAIGRPEDIAALEAAAAPGATRGTAR